MNSYKVIEAGKDQNGKTIVLGTMSGKLIEQGGLKFKDLAGTGELLPYEDWRLTDEARARDLAGRLSIEEIAGLMLYSAHQCVPASMQGPFIGHYDGKSLAESGANKDFDYAYDLNLTIREKIEAIATRIYGADGVNFTKEAEAESSA